MYPRARIQKICQRGSNFDWSLNTAKRATVGPPAKVFKMAIIWRGDVDPTTTALWLKQESKAELHIYFVIVQGGGGGGRTPCPPLWIRTWSLPT